MDTAAAVIVSEAVGVVVFVVLWIRVRAFERLAGAESERRLEVTREAIDMLNERVSPLTANQANEAARNQGRSVRGRSRG